MSTYNESGSGGVQLGGSPIGTVAPGIVDSFTDAAGTDLAAHVSESGGTWSYVSLGAPSGALITASGTARVSGAFIGIQVLGMYSGGATFDDFTASASIKLLSTSVPPPIPNSSSGICGVFGRLDVTGSNPSYVWATFNAATKELAAGQGEYTTTAAVSTTLAWDVGEEHTVSLQVVGAQATVLADETPVLGPFAVTAPSSSQHGIGIILDSDGQHSPSDDTQAQIDQFRIVAPGSALVTYNVSATGGVQIGGRADPAYAVFVASGGIQIGGATHRYVSFNPRATGGVQLGGTALYGNWYVYTSRGGVQVGGSGSSSSSCVYSTSGRGGVQIGGHNGPPNIYAYVGMGGVQLGGSGVRSHRYNLRSTGGVGLGGSMGSFAASYTHHASGGVQAGGSAPMAGLLYAVYANAGDDGPIDYDRPIAVTDQLTYTTAVLAVPGAWKFGVRASKGGMEEKNLDAAVRLVLSGSGADVTNVPPPPLSLSVHAVKGGVLRATWNAPVDATNRVVGYRVYLGAGWPNYGVPAAVVLADHAVGGAYSVDLSGLVDGTTYAVGVRAYNATGEEANQTIVHATADATGPTAVVGLSASIDHADWN